MKALLLLLLVISMTGCVTVPDAPFRASTNIDSSVKGKIFVVEFNDQGNPHIQKQIDDLTSSIKNHETSDDLVIFVHGWHHNGKETDGNYIGFKSFMSELNSAKTQYTGLYIGWRGDQNDPFGIDGSIEPIDLLSLSERKNVSVKVGENGLSKLLLNINQLIHSKFIKRYALIGHSLGGSAVFHAAKDMLENKDDNIFVLLNPAITDLEYKPIAKLRTPGGRFPKMVTLQADNDLAINFIYDLVSVGADPVGDSWTISHDLNACPDDEADCQADFKARKAKLALEPDCKTLFSDNAWVITSREDNGEGRLTCAQSNELLSWVVVARDHSVEQHNGILTKSQAAALLDILRINKTSDIK